MLAHSISSHGKEMGPDLGPDPQGHPGVPAGPGWAPGHVPPNPEVTPSGDSPQGLWKRPSHPRESPGAGESTTLPRGRFRM